VLREANLGSLLGAISTGNPKEDKPFPVGAQKSFAPEKSGQLYLRMHDIETPNAPSLYRSCLLFAVASDATKRKDVATRLAEN
jgi:hypothetical protein